MKNIKDLRKSCNLTQKEFAEYFHIPLSTLRKWEQGESNPPEYLLRLLAYTLPKSDNTFMELSGYHGAKYYFNPNRNTVSDSLGNEIKVKYNITEINKNNLGIYLDDLFKDYYQIIQNFNHDCEYDSVDNITWSILE